MEDDRRRSQGDELTPPAPESTQTPHRYQPAEADRAAGDLLARFTSTAALDQAIVKLEAAGFHREDLGLPEIDPEPKHTSPEAGSAAADTGVEASQSRAFHSSVGGAIAAMIGALIVASTGGSVAAIAGAAVGAGVVVAVVVELLVRASSRSVARKREQKASAGKLVLAVRVATPEKHARATAILRENGGALV